MFDAEKGSAERCDGSDLHIGLVQARFNESITNALADACRSQLLELGVREEHITHVLVPGALEIPTALQALAERDEFDALIAIGCIIRGVIQAAQILQVQSQPRARICAASALPALGRSQQRRGD